MNTRKISLVILVTVVTLLLSACSSTQTPNPAKAQEYHDQGMMMMTFGGERDPEKAASYFTKAVKADSNFVKSYNARGVAYVVLGEYDKARADFEKTLEIDPNYELAQKNLEYLNAGEYDQATGIEF